MTFAQALNWYHTKFGEAPPTMGLNFDEDVACKALLTAIERNQAYSEEEWFEAIDASPPDPDVDL